MKYNQLRDDLLAINTLLQAGEIDHQEAHDMRQYVESL